MVGIVCYKLNKVGSTNTYLKDLSKREVLKEGTQVTARHQQSGKGQRGKSWLVEADKNLTTSILLRPSFLNSDFIFDLSKCVAVGIAEALEDFIEPAVCIKWPNDIFSESRKLGGILIENQWSGSELSESIIGFGINVFQENFPREAGNPVSLLQLQADLSADLDDIRRAINNRLEVNYELLKAGGREQIDQTYHKRLYQRSELSKFEWLDPKAESMIGKTDVDGRIVFEGRIDSVDKFGQLVLEVDGQRRCFAVGEISYIL